MQEKLREENKPNSPRINRLEIWLTQYRFVPEAMICGPKEQYSKICLKSTQMITFFQEPLENNRIANLSPRDQYRKAQTESSVIPQSPSEPWLAL